MHYVITKIILSPHNIGNRENIKVCSKHFILRINVQLVYFRTKSVIFYNFMNQLFSYFFPIQNRNLNFAFFLQMATQSLLGHAFKLVFTFKTENLAFQKLNTKSFQNRFRSVTTEFRGYNVSTPRKTVK